MRSWIDKIERAEKHIEELRGEIGAYIAAHRYRKSENIDAQARKYTVRIESLTPLPSSIPMILGDVLNNLRCALDHIACAVRRNARSKFPIFTDPAAKDAISFIAEVRKASSPAVALIEIMQPYHAVDPGGHSLGILQALNNQDKHRSLIVAVAAAFTKKLSVIHADGSGSIFETLRQNGGALAENGAIEFTAPYEGPDAKPDVEFTPAFVVAFGEYDPIKGKAILPVVEDLLGFVADAVGRIATAANI